MKKNLSSAQITSLDEFGQRRYLHPAEVKGKYRTLRTIVEIVLSFIFVVLPWFNINGHQSLLLDIQKREFYFFGFMLKAHNAPMLLFILLGGALTLAFVTSVWGRVWCGWTCPQTVFIDGWFRRVEEFIEGPYLKRLELDRAGFSFSKLVKKSSKWIIFYFLSAFIAHSFLAYFVGSYKFISIIQNGPSSNFTLFTIAQFVTLVLLFDFGWFREQFCTIMCPYGRIQGLLIGENSLAVVYDEKRNDCVNCNRCVSACPIGIDIRNGLQMECIACTACIDACDEIMDKVKKPRGLIKYNTLNDKPISILKPRSLLYMLGISICVIGLIYNLAFLKHSEAFILRSQNDPFTVKADETGTSIVTNHFRVNIHNQSSDEKFYKLEILNRPEITVIKPQVEIKIPSQKSFDWHFFVSLPLENFKNNNKAKVRVYDSKDANAFSKEFEITILGPLQ